MKARILRDIDSTSLEEKINKVIAETETGLGGIKEIAYQTTVIPQMRGKEVVGNKVEYSVLIFIEE